MSLALGFLFSFRVQENFMQGKSLLRESAGSTNGILSVYELV